MPEQQAQAEEDNLWARILLEVQSKSSSSLPHGSVLVLGENESGKTSLLARLQRKDDPKKGAGIEYHFLEVNMDYKDGSYAYQLGGVLPDVTESTRLGVWVLDGDSIFAPLMRFALTPDTLDRALVILCASMQEPWSILESLQKWSQLLDNFIRSSDKIDRAQARDGCERQRRFWQEYVEPLDSSSHSEMGAKVPSMEPDESLLPLADGVLTDNMGVPIIVVITKCDGMSVLEKEYDYKDEHFDFIQYHVRKFCLKYGAACVYTSSMDQRNCATLYKYMLHRIYGFPFTQPASVVEKEAVFIPAGWDNEKKIGILPENWRTMKATDPFAQHIVKPTLRRPVQRDQEIQAEDDQSFLERLRPQFNAAPNPAEQRADRPDRVAAGNESPLPSRLSRNPNSAGNLNAMRSKSPKQQQDGLSPRAGAGGLPPAQTPENSTLAHFFNNLLKSKTTAGGPQPAGASPPQQATNGPAKPIDSEAAERELNRIQQKTAAVKELNNSVTNNNNPNSPTTDENT